jgi:hypothetical protein
MRFFLTFLLDSRRSHGVMIFIIERVSFRYYADDTKFIVTPSSRNRGDEDCVI